jgi:hypothetical protein
MRLANERKVLKGSSKSDDGEAERDRVRRDRGCCDDNPSCGRICSIGDAQSPYHLLELIPTVCRDSYVCRESREVDVVFVDT